jgi:hypothetical protein
MEEGCQLIVGLWRWSHDKPTIKGCVRQTTLKTSISRCPAMSMESGAVSFVIKPAGEEPPSARKTGIGEARERIGIWCSETKCVSINVSSEQPESTKNETFPEERPWPDHRQGSRRQFCESGRSGGVSCTRIAEQMTLLISDGLFPAS